MSAPKPPSPSRTPPLKRFLKGTMLWCARWLVGGDEFYAGRVKVEVTAMDDGESVTVRSGRGLDGLGEPELLAERGGGVGIDGEGQGEPVAAGVSHAELVRVLLSQDERNLLKTLSLHGPCSASVVMEKVKMEKSRFWPLWGNLQQRGLVADADEGASGFVVAVVWVRAMVGVGGGGAEAA